MIMSVLPRSCYRVALFVSILLLFGSLCKAEASDQRTDLVEIGYYETPIGDNFFAKMEKYFENVNWKGVKPHPMGFVSLENFVGALKDNVYYIRQFISKDILRRGQKNDKFPIFTKILSEALASHFFNSLVVKNSGDLASHSNMQTIMNLLNTLGRTSSLISLIKPFMRSPPKLFGSHWVTMPQVLKVLRYTWPRDQYQKLAAKMFEQYAEVEWYQVDFFYKEIYLKTHDAVNYWNLWIASLPTEKEELNTFLIHLMRSGDVKAMSGPQARYLLEFRDLSIDAAKEIFKAAVYSGWDDVIDLFLKDSRFKDFGKETFIKDAIYPRRRVRSKSAQRAPSKKMKLSTMTVLFKSSSVLSLFDRDELNHLIAFALTQENKDCVDAILSHNDALNQVSLPDILSHIKDPIEYTDWRRTAFAKILSAHISRPELEVSNEQWTSIIDIAFSQRLDPLLAALLDTPFSIRLDSVLSNSVNYVLSSKHSQIYHSYFSHKLRRLLENYPHLEYYFRTTSIFVKKLNSLLASHAKFERILQNAPDPRKLAGYFSQFYATWPFDLFKAFLINPVMVRSLNAELLVNTVSELVKKPAPYCYLHTDRIVAIVECLVQNKDHFRPTSEQWSRLFEHSNSITKIDAAFLILSDPTIRVQLSAEARYAFMRNLEGLLLSHVLLGRNFFDLLKSQPLWPTVTQEVFPTVDWDKLDALHEWGRLTYFSLFENIRFDPKLLQFPENSVYHKLYKVPRPGDQLSMPSLMRRLRNANGTGRRTGQVQAALLVTDRNNGRVLPPRRSKVLPPRPVHGFLGPSGLPMGVTRAIHG